MKTVMEPGDVFRDNSGVVWVVLNLPTPEPKAQLVYMTEGNLSSITESYLDENELAHPESDCNVRIPLKYIPEPFILIAELGKG